MVPEVNYYFYNRIKLYRELRGMTRARLSRLVGVDYNCVFRWEKQSYQPTALNARILCSVLDVDFNELFYFSEYPLECS